MRRPSRQGLLPVCTIGTAPQGQSNAQWKSVIHVFLFAFQLLSIVRRHSMCISYCLATCPAVVLIAMSGANAQPGSDTTEERLALRGYFSEVRAGNHPGLSQVLEHRDNESAFLKSLQPFLLDSVEVIRAKAYELASMIASGSSDLTVKHGNGNSREGMQRSFRRKLRSCPRAPYALQEE